MLQLFMLLVWYPFWASTGLYATKLIRGSKFERWFALTYCTTWHFVYWLPRSSWGEAQLWLIINLTIATFLINSRLGPIMVIGWGFTSMVGAIFDFNVQYWDGFIFVVYALRTLDAARSKK